jgi:hypothetical protein
MFLESAAKRLLSDVHNLGRFVERVDRRQG